MRVEYVVDGDAHVGKKLVKRFNGRPYLGQVVHVVLLSYHKVFSLAGRCRGRLKRNTLMHPHTYACALRSASEAGQTLN